MNEFHDDEAEIEAEYQAKREASEAELHARMEEAEHANADDIRGAKNEVD